MSPISNWPNSACELMPSSSNMADHIVGWGTEGFVGRDGGAEFVIIPRRLRFCRLLDFEQIHRMDFSAIGPDDSLAEELVVSRHLLHFRDNRFAIGVALERLDRLEIVRDRRIDAGMDHGRMHTLELGRELLREFPICVV